MWHDPALIAPEIRQRLTSAMSDLAVANHASVGSLVSFASLCVSPEAQGQQFAVIVRLPLLEPDQVQAILAFATVELLPGASRSMSATTVQQPHSAAGSLVLQRAVSDYDQVPHGIYFAVAFDDERTHGVILFRDSGTVVVREDFESDDFLGRQQVSE